MPEERAADCVFCTHREQPLPLFETPSLYVLPDKFPLRPGHILIVPKEHFRCYAMARIDLLHELEETASHVRRFLEQVYGDAVLILENGIVGQTVFHAHLHLVPLRISGLPAAVVGHPDVIPVEGWRDVQAYFAEHGAYRFIEVGKRRYLFAPHSNAALQMMRDVAATMAGLTLGDQGFVKTTTAEDVAALGHRWREWAINHPAFARGPRF